MGAVEECHREDHRADPKDPCIAQAQKDEYRPYGSQRDRRRVCGHVQISDMGDVDFVCHNRLLSYIIFHIFFITRIHSVCSGP